ncbi:MAG TPA: phosphoglycerate mutase [Luteimonas sp.]
MATVTLLLPTAAKLTGAPSPALAAALGRSDRMPGADPGDRAQLLRYFDVVPNGWPIAALTRQLDVGDAAQGTWLRADPAWVRPDINGARLLACGRRLQLDQDDIDALLPALRQLFEDSGFAFDAPKPAHWYLRLPQGIQLPVFAEPDEALGADLFDHLPADAHHPDGAARDWRALLSEAQVVLHNHPWNARRAAAGKPPINSLWFWGGGEWPHSVHASCTAALSDDSSLRGLANAAGANVGLLPPRFEPLPGDTLIDLRPFRDLARVTSVWLMPAIGALKRGTIRRLHVDFADGIGFLFEPAQRWRFWRRPVSKLVPSDPSSGSSPADPG